MGWASAGAIFDLVADALIEAQASDDTKQKCLGPLIDALQDNDWDTEHISLGRYSGDPVIVGVFAEHGVKFDEDDLEPSPS